MFVVFPGTIFKQTDRGRLGSLHLRPQEVNGTKKCGVKFSFLAYITFSTISRCCYEELLRG